LVEEAPPGNNNFILQKKVVCEKKKWKQQKLKIIFQLFFPVVGRFQRVLPSLPIFKVTSFYLWFIEHRSRLHNQPSNSQSQALKSSHQKLFGKVKISNLIYLQKRTMNEVEM